ncbi:hypothetical protein [Streptomyces sp. NPDC057293]|uniref:hypothetical protein n=1 Tax=unclassified Streptomyces TaxID=2593676 RepID=UPI00363C433E
MEIAATSTEYVRVTAKATVGGSPVSPSAPPQFAFQPTSATGNPAVEEWLTGEWVTPHARILIGPNGGVTTLEAGEYRVWLAWTAGAEAPVYRTPGTITVY